MAPSAPPVRLMIALQELEPGTVVDPPCNSSSAWCSVIGMSVVGAASGMTQAIPTATAISAA
ncbi:hypothetical protein D3C84_1202850 [compost metagenome]